jgi:MFS transporter, AAHS family, 3-hydroxyphenylpropionic acid transporter
VNSGTTPGLALEATRDPAAVLLTVVLCFLTSLCEGFDLQAAGVAAGGIRAEFHPDAARLGYFFSASTLGLFVGAAFGGRLSDRVGRKSVLVGSVAAFGLFSLLTPLAANISALILARLLTGLGLGGALPNLIALGSESAPAGRRSANVTIIFAGAPIGGAIASLISLLIYPGHWRVIFIVGGVVPLLIVPLLATLLTESHAFRLARARPSGKGASRVLDLISEKLWWRTLLLWASSLLALLTLYLLLNWLPLLMVAGGMTYSQAAGTQILFNAGGASGALYIGTQLETQRRKAGVLVTFIGLPCLLALLIMAAGHLAPTLAVVFLLGAAILSAQAILYAYAPLLYPTAIRGVGVGFVVAMGRIGSILGPLFGSMLVGAGRGSTQVLAGLLPIVLACSLCAVALVWRAPAPAEGPAPA